MSEQQILSFYQLTDDVIMQLVANDVVRLIAMTTDEAKAFRRDGWIEECVQFFMTHTDYYYIDDRAQYVAYNATTGIYEMVRPAFIEHCIYTWMRLYNIPQKQISCNNILALLKTRRLAMNEMFNVQKHIICVKNGMLNLKTLELTSYNPIYKCTKKFDITYQEQPTATPIFKRLNTEIYPRQMTLLRAFIHGLLLGDRSAEMMLWIYGPPNTGKSTICDQLIGKMLQPILAFEPITKIGNGWANAHIAGARANYVKEATMTYLNDKTVTALKGFVDSEGVTEATDVIYNGQEDMHFELIPITVTNQFPKLSQEANRNAFYKRCCLLCFDQLFNTDNQFKQNFKLEIDSIFSQIVQEKYVPLSVGYITEILTDTRDDNMHNYQLYVAHIWETNSYPLLELVNTLYERCETLDENNKPYYLEQREVNNRVKLEMNERGIKLEGKGKFSHNDIIEETFLKLRITLVKHENVWKYKGIKEKFVKKNELDEEITDNEY